MEFWKISVEICRRDKIINEIMKNEDHYVSFKHYSSLQMISTCPMNEKVTVAKTSNDVVSYRKKQERRDQKSRGWMKFME